ncbi:MAG: hypothetical protein HON09_09795 [Flavobacteriaceae bacterium]|nr:hypothetical protein [Flavobacteriaceae bacterium]
MKKNYSVKKIVEFAENDQDFIVLVVRTFLKEIPPDLKAMLVAIESWTKSSKNKSTIKEHMDLVVVKIEMVLKELKENYSL